MFDRRLAWLVWVFLLLWSFPLSGEETNLFLNAGFRKDGAEIPAPWYMEVYPEDAARFVVEEDDALPGGSCLSIINHRPADARVVQEVRVERDRVYRISCLVKTGGLEADRGGANISVLNGGYSSPEVFATGGEWRELTVYVRTPPRGLDTLQVAFRLGGFGAMNKGEASFARVVMEQVDSPPPGVHVASLLAAQASGDGEYTAAAGGERPAGSAGEGYKRLLYLVLGGVAVGLLIIFELRIFTPQEENR